MLVYCAFVIRYNICISVPELISTFKKNGLYFLSTYNFQNLLHITFSFESHKISVTQIFIWEDISYHFIVKKHVWESPRSYCL